MSNIYITPSDQYEIEVWTHTLHIPKQCSFQILYNQSIDSLKKEPTSLFIYGRINGLIEIFKRSSLIYKAIKLKNYSSLIEIDRIFYDPKIKDNYKPDLSIYTSNNNNIMYAEYTSNNIMYAVVHPQSPLYKELEKFLQIWY